ncbi:MAG: MFS transporter [Desulfobacteraceae bacterium]|nr:MFS transporter [Desulfobacteraceae bacterium]
MNINTSNGASTPTEKPFRAPAVLMVSFCHFIHDIYSSFLFPLLPLLIEKLSLSMTRAGFLSTAMRLPALLNPIIGVWADRISVRWFIILAPSMTAIPMCLLGVVPSYAMLLILLFITGISSAMFHVPAPVIISELSGDYKGRGMSFFMVGGELARAIGPLAAVGAISLLGLEGFYPIMILGIACSIWLYFKFKDIPVTIEKRSDITLKKTWLSTRALMLPLAGILTARGFMHACLTTFLPAFITQKSGGLWLAGASLTIVEAAGVAGVMAAGALSDRFGRKKILWIAIISSPVFFLAFLAAKGWVQYAVLALTGFSLLSTTPVMLAMVQEFCRESPAVANGIFIMFIFTARSTVTVLVGFIADKIGLQATFMCTAVIAFAGIPFLLMIPEATITNRRPGA